MLFGVDDLCNRVDKDNQPRCHVVISACVRMGNKQNDDDDNDKGKHLSKGKHMNRVDGADKLSTNPYLCRKVGSSDDSVSVFCLHM